MAEPLYRHSTEQIAEASDHIASSMLYATSPLDFVENIAEEYRGSAMGRASVLRMQRAARFIQYDEAAPEQRAIRSHYYGELLGSLLLDNIEQAHALGGDLAHAYVQYRLAQSAMLCEGVEKSVDLRHRHKAVAKFIRSELTGAHPGLASLEPYEAYSERSLATLTKDRALRETARNGFRLILLEALFPSALNDTNNTLRSVMHVPYTNKKPIISPFNAAADTPSIQQLSTELSHMDTQLAPPPDEVFQNATRTKKILTRFHRKKMRDFKVLGMVSAITEPALDEHCERELNKRVAEKSLFVKGELVALAGDYFAKVATSDNEVAEARFIHLGHHQEVRGEYEGITVISAPSIKELADRRKNLKRPKDDTEKIGTAVPAIKLLHPVIITYDENEKGSSEFGAYDSIEVPLNYRNYTIRRSTL